MSLPMQRHHAGVMETDNGRFLSASSLKLGTARAPAKWVSVIRKQAPCEAAIVTESKCQARYGQCGKRPARSRQNSCPGLRFKVTSCRTTLGLAPNASGNQFVGSNRSKIEIFVRLPLGTTCSPNSHSRYRILDIFPEVSFALGIRSPCRQLLRLIPNHG